MTVPPSTALSAHLLRWLPPALWLIAAVVAALTMHRAHPRPADAAIQVTDSAAAPTSAWPGIDVFHARAASTSTGRTAAGWHVVALRLSAPAGAILAQADGAQHAVQAGDRLDSGLAVLTIDARGVQIDDGHGPRWLQLPGHTGLLQPVPHAAPVPPAAPTPTPVDTPADGWVVPADSPHTAALALAGLRPGDRIVQVNQRAVQADGQPLSSLLRRGQTLQLQWLRDGQPHTRAVRIP